MAGGHDPAHHLALSRVERLVLGFGVAPRVLRGVGVEREIHERGAQTLHLLLHRRSYVIGFDLGTQTTGAGNGLQTRHARTDYEYARGSNGAGRGHHHRKHPGQCLGRHEHRFVSGDGGHRRQRVHALRARDSGYQFHRERGDAAGSEVARRLRLAKGFGEADDDLSRTQLRQVVPSVHQVRAKRPDGQNRLCFREHLSTVCREAGALVHVGVVGESSRAAGPGFDQDIEPRSCKRRDGGRYGRDALFARKGLCWDADDHGILENCAVEEGGTLFCRCSKRRDRTTSGPRRQEMGPVDNVRGCG